MTQQPRFAFGQRVFIAVGDAGVVVKDVECIEMLAKTVGVSYRYHWRYCEWLKSARVEEESDLCGSMEELETHRRRIKQQAEDINKTAEILRHGAGGGKEGTSDGNG